MPLSDVALTLSKQYKIESGGDLVKIFRDEQTDSGNALERAFCSNCGSNLSIRNVTNPAASSNVVICAGTVDDNYKEFNPQSELFPHRRHAWVPEVKKRTKPAETKM